MPTVIVRSPIGRYRTARIEGPVTVACLYRRETMGVLAPVVASVNDRPVLRRDWQMPLACDAVVTLTILPRDRGSLGTVLSLAVVVAATVAAPYLAGAIAPGLIAAGGIGSTLLTTGIGLGLSVLGGMLVNALLPPQKPSLGDFGPRPALERGSPTYALSAQGQQARLLDAIPVGYGRQRVFPDYGSQPFTVFRDNEQELFLFLVLGTGRYAVERIEIENTTLWDETGGLNTSQFPGASVEIRAPAEAIGSFPLNVYTVPEVAVTEMPGSNEAGHGWIGPYALSPPETVINALHIDLAWPGGIFRIQDDGSLALEDADYRFEIREIDDDGAAIGAWQNIVTQTKAAATQTGQRLTIFHSVATGRYEIRGQRTDARVLDTRRQSLTQWASAKGFIPQAQADPHTTRIAIKVRSGTTLNDRTQRRIAVTATRILPVYDAEADSWSEQPTRSIAWAAADVLRNTTYGAGLADDRIDLGSLAALDATWTARGDRFDGRFDTQLSIGEALERVLAVGRAFHLDLGSIITLRRDEPQIIPAACFGPRNIVADSFRLAHVFHDTETPDRLAIEFLDQDSWTPAEVEAVIGDAAIDRPARIKAFGIVQHDQAWREAAYQLAVSQFRRDRVSFETELDGRLVLRGDAIELSHPLLDAVESGDVVGWDAGALRLTLDPPATWGEGQHYIVLRRPNGRPWGPARVAPAGDPIEVLELADDGQTTMARTAYAAIAVDSSDHDALTTSTGVAIDDVVRTDPNSGATHYTLAVGAGAFSRLCIVERVRPRGQDRLEIEAVVEDPAVHLADQATPPAKASIGSLPPPADGPVLAGLTAGQRAGTAAAPILDVSLAPHDDATSYVIEIGYDLATWTIIHEGTSPHATAPVRVGTVYVRAAARRTLQGPYTAPVAVTTGVETTLPGTVANLALQSAYRGGAWAISWLAASGAESYEIRVFSETVPGSGTFDRLEAVRTTAGLELSFGQAEAALAGGPWRRVEVSVVARNAVGDGPPITLMIEDAAPAAVGSPRVGTITASSIEVLGDPVTDTDGIVYELHMSETAGFTPDAATRIYTGSTPAHVAPGLAPATTYHFRWVTRDSFPDDGTLGAAFSATTAS